MLQLVIWMLCVYMVLKAAEFWLIASNADAEIRRSSRTTAVIWGLLAVVAALFFFTLSLGTSSLPPRTYETNY